MKLDLDIPKHLYNVIELEALRYNVTVEKYILTCMRLHVNGISLDDLNLDMVFKKS